MKKIKVKFFFITTILFALLLIILNFPQTFFAEDSINVSANGIVGDGITDYTLDIQNLIDEQGEKGGGTIVFTKGTYIIDAVSSIVLRDNITLKFEEGSMLKAKPTKSPHYQIIRIHDVSNVNIIGKLKIVGDKLQHQGTTGEWGMGISIRGAENVYIENVNILECWGDGIYIGSTEKKNYNLNIRLENLLLENNRRQGISIISARNLEIRNIEIYNTNGTGPGSGIAIEPNTLKEYLDKIDIYELKTSGNQGFGLQVNLKHYKNSENVIKINVDSINNIKDGISIKEIDKVEGELKVGEQYYIAKKKILPTPEVKEFTINAKYIIGSAESGTQITVKKLGIKLASANTDLEGKFKIAIPEQKLGTELSITASDVNNNLSKEKIITVKESAFQDINSDHWAYSEVMLLVDKKIIEGYKDKFLKIDNNVTRAEAAKMLTIALDLQSSNTNIKYKDVDASHWSSKNIVAATSAGFFEGYPNGLFYPERNLTRSEMAKILTLAYNFEGTNPIHFIDVPSKHWALKYIQILSKNGITRGYPNNTFQPDLSTTRAEFSTFLTRSMEKTNR